MLTFIILLILLYFFIWYNKKQIFVFLGSSGSGKTTLGTFLHKISRKFEKLTGIKLFVEVVSHTTRQMREGEVEGETYYYVSKETFDDLNKIESVEYAGNHYCLSKEEFERKMNSSNKLFIIADAHGVRQIKEEYEKYMKVIFFDISLEEMKERMKERGDAKKDIQSRLEYCQKNNELDNWRIADRVINANLNPFLVKVQLLLNLFF